MTFQVTSADSPGASPGIIWLVAESTFRSSLLQDRWAIAVTGKTAVPSFNMVATRVPGWDSSRVSLDQSTAATIGSVYSSTRSLIVK